MNWPEAVFYSVCVISAAVAIIVIVVGMYEDEQTELSKERLAFNREQWEWERDHGLLGRDD
jgi:hypothetical protein